MYKYIYCYTNFEDNFKTPCHLKQSTVQLFYKHTESPLQFSGDSTDTFPLHRYLQIENSKHRNLTIFSEHFLQSNYYIKYSEAIDNIRDGEGVRI